MITIPVINGSAERVGEVKLPATVFGAPFNRHLVWEVVRNQLANKRRGTACTKVRSEVSGSGRKLWKQKHTGRARMGEIRSPLWRKGGTVFGPKPRDYSYRMPVKARRNALKGLLSEMVRRETLLVMDTLELESPKTKSFIEKYGKACQGAKKTLIYSGEVARDAYLASRNLADITVKPVGEINVYDISRHERVLLTDQAAKTLAEELGS